MKSELKGYVKFILQNHIDAVIYSYIEFLKTHKEYDIREISNHEIEFSSYYRRHISRYLISILSNKVNDEVQRKIKLWENSELSSSQNFYPVLPQDLFMSYIKLNKVIHHFIYKYTNDIKKKFYILQELDRLDDLIDSAIIYGYKEILLNRNNNSLTRYIN